MIMRTSYGEAKETATIYKSQFAIGDEYLIHTTADNLDIKDKCFPSAAEAISAMEKRGYLVRHVHDFRGDRWDCTHTETQDFIQRLDREKKNDEKKWLQAEKGFLRYGKPPASGQSYNTRDGITENGVSCYPAEFLPDGDYRIIVTEVQALQAKIYSAGRRAYRLYGPIIGTGSDGEPLLKVERAEML